MKNLCIASGCVMMLALFCSSASAQYSGRYVPPAGRTLPNQLNYFRQDVGVMDPYNTFVNPTRQLNQQLNDISLQENSDYRRTQKEIGQVRRSLAAPTGIGAGYMNHQRYFNTPIGQTRR
jgi:hypothetical protein